MHQKLRRLIVVAGIALLAGCGAQKQDQAGTDATKTHDGSLKRVQQSKVLAWGADVVGGVPYVYEDPAHKGQYTGFEMDIARAVARELGVEARLEVRPWDTLIPELQRHTFDMAMNGIEDTPARAQIVLFSDPYFLYAQQLTVRKTTTAVASLEDLKGKRVATLSGTAAEDILRNTPGIETVIQPEITYSYRDLEQSKVDAVLLDTPIAAAYGATNPKLKNVGESIHPGRYVIAFRQEDQSLRDAVNQALAKIKESGELATIYRKYGIMDQHQAEIGVR
jgi:polar amino acid transport system substrate-binding protein